MCLFVEERATHAVPLALDVLFRPLDKSDPTPRDEVRSLKKHQVEGHLSERQVVLGWLIDTRLHRVFLEPEKAADWRLDIEQMIDKGTTNSQQLAKVLGRLNHLAYFMTTGKYFLPRLRYRLTKDGNFKNQYKRIHLAKWDIADLKLWLTFINAAEMFSAVYSQVLFYVLFSVSF